MASSSLPTMSSRAWRTARWSSRRWTARTSLQLRRGIENFHCTRRWSVAGFQGIEVAAWEPGTERKAENPMNAKSVRVILLAILFTAAVVAWAAPAAKKHTEWKTYRDPDYGFMLDYPGSITFYPGHPVEPTQGAMFPICDHTIACFQYNGHALDGTITDAIGISVNIVRGVKTETECIDSIGPDLDSSKTIHIHGTLFHYRSEER